METYDVQFRQEAMDDLIVIDRSDAQPALYQIFFISDYSSFVNHSAISHQ